MMVLSALRPDASLFEFLAQRARSAPVRRLAIDAAGGIAVAAAAVWGKPAAQFMIGSLAACFFSYGAWGLVDRVRSRVAISGSPRIAGLADALGALCVVVGVLAAAGVLFAIWAAALGTWIS
jgi:hypothetical protein